MKICTKCKTDKLDEDFYKHKYVKSGLSSQCKKCTSDYGHENKDRINERRRNDGRKDIRNEQSRKWRETTHGKMITKDIVLKKRYNISLIEYNELLKNQDYKCAVCLSPETSIDKRTGKLRELSVDHNHYTGEARGLLCRSCNTALGSLKENEDIIYSLLNYIKSKKMSIVL